MELFNFQKEKANYLLNIINQTNIGLDCSVVGSGKTYIAMDVLIKLNRPYIIICPKIVISQWENIVEKYDKSSNLIYVTNYEQIKTHKLNEFNKSGWNLPKDTVILFDEAHKLKGYQTQNSKLLTLINLNKYKLYLISATIADSPLAFVNIAKTIGLCYNEYAFLREYGCKRGFQNKGWVFSGDIQYLAKLHNIIFHDKNHCGVRITYDDISQYMPKQCIDLFYIKDYYNKINVLYTYLEAYLENTEIILPSSSIFDEDDSLIITSTFDKLVNDKPIDLRKIESELNSIQLVLVKRTRLRQLIEMIKAKIMVDIIESYFNDKYSIVVMFNYSYSINLLNTLLTQRKIYNKTITGQTNNKDEIINEFQQDNLHVLIMNIKAAGLGISLHDIHGNYKRISFISPSDNIYELQQSLGRIYRTGSKTNVIQYIITVANTIEEAVNILYKTKLKQMNMILDGKK